MATARSPRSPRSTKRRKRDYHHGDLKAALVEAAAEILRRKDLEALTLRAVARKAGVSEAAPYRHFTDRRALLAAVAERGFLRMREAMLASMASAEGRQGLKGVAIAYVRFALENPAEYRLMFGSALAERDDLPALRDAGRAVLGFVASAMAQLQKANLIGPGDPNLIAATTWSMLHGLALLTLDKQTTGIGVDLDAMLDEATQIMMFGMAPRLDRTGPNTTSR